MGNYETKVKMDNKTEDANMSQRFSSKRYRPDEVLNNGSILNEIFLHDDILVEILSYVHYKDLLKNCLYVCQKWKELIQHEVWKLKAERGLLNRLTSGKPCRRLPDLVYQGICCNIGYNRNLLKNNSGQHRFKHWQILQNGGDRIKVENPPVGVVRPDDATYEEPSHCFVTSYGDCEMKQIICLQSNGVHSTIMDQFQPEINVSEWYAARWDCAAYYKMEVLLLDETKNIVDEINKEIYMRDDQHTNGWHVMSHTFKSYGPGVKYIVFKHTGRDLQYWAGHYGSKIANAQVVVNIPNV